MTKILFNLDGKQQLVEVGDGGGVCSDAQVLWDERDHGPIPEVVVGNMIAYDEDNVRKLSRLEETIPSHAVSAGADYQAKINLAARQYLAATDWYVIRELDGGKCCPEEIKQARLDARSSIA